MGVGGTPFSQQQMIRIGMLFAAFVLGIIVIFSGWWTWKVSMGGDSAKDSFGPFDDGSNTEGDFSSAVTITGILCLFALVGLTLLLGVELAPLVQRNPLPIVRLLALGGSVAFGLAAVLHATFAWPSAVDADAFWDSTSRSTPTPMGTVTTKLSLYAGFGWYAAIVTFVLIPAAAFFLYWRDAKMNPTAPMVASEPATPEPPAPASVAKPVDPYRPASEPMLREPTRTDPVAKLKKTAPRAKPAAKKATKSKA